MFEPAHWRPYELQPLSCVQYLSIDETPKISLAETQSPPGPTVPPEASTPNRSNPQKPLPVQISHLSYPLLQPSTLCAVPVQPPLSKPPKTQNFPYSTPDPNSSPLTTPLHQILWISAPLHRISSQTFLDVFAKNILNFNYTFSSCRGS